MPWKFVRDLCFHEVLQTTVIGQITKGNRTWFATNPQSELVSTNTVTIYIYIYIVIHRQTVSLYHNSSVRVDT